MIFHEQYSKRHNEQRLLAIAWKNLIIPGFQPMLQETLHQVVDFYRGFISFIFFQVYFSFIMEWNSLLISLTSISKREFLSFALTRTRISLSTKSNADKSGIDPENQDSKKAQARCPKSKKKKASSRNTPSNNSSVEALIKTG